MPGSSPNAPSALLYSWLILAVVFGPAADGQVNIQQPDQSTPVDSNASGLPPGSQMPVTLPLGTDDEAGATRKLGSAFLQWAPDQVIVKLNGDLAELVDQQVDAGRAATFLSQQILTPHPL